MSIAIAWRDLRRMKTPALSQSIPQGQLDTMDVMANLGLCSMIDLSVALRIDASTATRAVDRLVESGMAVRTRSSEDARTVLVELTRDGRQLERRLTAERLVVLEDILGRFSQVERETLASSLRQLRDATDAANRSRADSPTTGTK